MQNTAKQNYPGFAAFYHTWTGNEVSLFYNTPEPTPLSQQNIWPILCYMKQAT